MTSAEIESIILKGNNHISDLAEESYAKWHSGKSVDAHVNKAKNVYRMIRALSRRNNMSSSKYVNNTISLLMILTKTYKYK